MYEFITSQIALTCITVFLVDHLIKYVVDKFIQDRRTSEKFFDSGGFPSGHTALVTTLFFSIGFETDWNPVLCSMAAVFASIVVFDALNLRYNAGLHAQALNIINQTIKVLQKPLTESLGHTYVEVLGGFILGTMVAVVSYLLI